MSWLGRAYVVVTLLRTDVWTTPLSVCVLLRSFRVLLPSSVLLLPPTLIFS